MTNRRGDIAEVRIKDLAYDGKSVGDIDGKIIFLNAGLPGETVRAEITRIKPNYIVGRVCEIIEKSAERIPARCVHFDICGGCTWQDLDYKSQLFYKRKQVADCLKHIGKFDDIDLAETIGAPEQFHYRNKMEFSFNCDLENGFTLGLHKRGQFSDIFDLHECHLASNKVVAIVDWIRAFVKSNGIPVYDVTHHTGYIRFLMVREGHNTGQIMINIVTTEGTFPNLSGLISMTKEQFPEVTTIVQNINNQKSNIARGEREIIHFGHGFIEEKILGHRFRIFANSFFQTNSKQTETLFRTAFELMRPDKNDRLLDLYCGAGTIGLSAADMVGDVVGIELEPSAIEAARNNAEINGIKNVRFHAGSVQEILFEKPQVLEGITCIVADPPRAGMHKKAIKAIIDSNCPKLIYISCNPSTFARDALLLSGAGYKLGRVIPVDMFPHTMHIELVSIFNRE